MPAELDRCVAAVKRDIAAGKLKEGSNPWAICNASLKRRQGVKKKAHRAGKVKHG